MKLSAFLLFLCAFQLLAITGNSQNAVVKLSSTQLTLEQFFDQIEKQTDYLVVFSNGEIDINEVIQVRSTSEKVSDYLRDAFGDKQVNIEFENNYIILSKGRLKTIAQQDKKMIRGKVTDEQGEPIIGANVVEKGTTNGEITNIDGKFSLMVNENAILQISYIGYITQEIPVIKQRNFTVILQEDFHALEEVVVVGYGTQSKVTLTGAVVAVDNKELNITKSQNVQNMLTGKVPGVRVIQKTSEPGTFNNQFDIRGFGSPLVVVDGVPRGEYQRLDPNEIESISVLKDASAAVYGVRAANGVVLITTKRGTKGKPKVALSMYYGLQIPADILRPVGAIDRMTLFNERSMRSLTDPRLTYSMEDINAYRTGEKMSTDWYDAVMRGNAGQQQYNASLSGGGEKVDYFINFGHTNQDGFFKSKDWTYRKFNLRSNVSAQVSKRLSLSVNLNAIFDETNRSNTTASEIFKTLWRSSPNDPIYANNTEPYYYKPSGNINNPVPMMDSGVFGKIKNKKEIIQSNINLAYDIPYIEGLTFKAMFSYDKTTDNNSGYRRQYNEYQYIESTGTYIPTAKNTPSSLIRSAGFSYTMMWNFALNYKKTFAGKHNVEGLLLFEESKTESDNFRAAREFSINDIPYLFAGNSLNQIGAMDAGGLIDYARQGLVGKVNYDFKSRYMAEFNFRYDASSRFPKSSRWGFFYGGSAGWRLSEEAFIKDNLSFVSNLKLRASYGKMGDDGALDYQFLSGFDYPASGDGLNNYPTGSVFGGKFVNALGFRVVANPNITWYDNETINLGLDLDLWNSKLGFTFDLFERNTSGLLANRNISLPGSFGAKMPQENLNEDKTRGLEIELSHKNRIQNVFYGVSANMSITRTKAIYRERSPFSNAYDNWRNSNTGRYKDIWFGYGDAGRYTSYEQIENSPVFTGIGTLPGDYIYEDWNGDGVIDGMDMYPIATITNGASPLTDKRNYPLLYYGISLFGEYKGFDLNLLFQGAAMSYIYYGEQLAAPLLWDGNALDFLMDRWHPVDTQKDPYDNTNNWVKGEYAYGSIGVNENSRFGIQKADYIRLKTLEFGYTVPQKLLTQIQKTGISNVRVYINAYNLFTISGVKGVDPERPSEQSGQMYPLSKSINFGLNMSF